MNPFKVFAVSQEILLELLKYISS